MLTLDPTTLQAIVNSAKLAAATDQRWVRAIDRAAAQLVENPYVEALDDHTLLIAGEHGVYTANGSCQCKAYQHGQPCVHRAMSRLYQRYTEAQTRQARRPAYDQALAEINELFA
jgi:hypothetical protein